MTDIISSQYAHTIPPSAPAVAASHTVIAITPSVSSFRRKRRKINSPVLVLDCIKSTSKGSDFDEDSEFNRADRDEVAVRIENTGDSMEQQINVDRGRCWHDADHLKTNVNMDMNMDMNMDVNMDIDMDNSMGTNSSLRHSLSDVSNSAVRTKSLDGPDSAGCLRPQSAGHCASRMRAFEDDSADMNLFDTDTDTNAALQSSNASESAASSIPSHDSVKCNSCITSLRSRHRRGEEKGANEEKEKHDDASRPVAFIEPSAIDRINKICSDPKPHSYGGEVTDPCNGPKRSSRLMHKNAPTSSRAHLHQSPISSSCSSGSSIAVRKTNRVQTSSSGALLSVKILGIACAHADSSYKSSRQRDASGCGAIPSRKTSSSSGRIGKGGDVKDMAKERAEGIEGSAIACSNTASRKNIPITVTNVPGSVANEFTSTVDVIDTKTPHAALAQPESDKCFDSNDSVCGSYPDQDCGIRSARARPDGGPGMRGEHNSSSNSSGSNSSSSSSSNTLKIKSLIVGSAHRPSSTSDEGCAEDAGMQTQLNVALAVSARTYSPPKTSDEGRISGIADSRCTRSYTAVALPFRDGLRAPPLQPLMKRYPSTSRSRMSSSLSSAYGSTLNSFDESGPGTSSSTMSMSSGRIDPHLVKGASSGVEGMEVSSVAIQPLQSVLSPSHASVAQQFSRSSSVTSSVSSTAFAAALPVPLSPSSLPTSSHDYRHSSFRARKMLQAAEQIVHRNRNDQL